MAKRKEQTIAERMSKSSDPKITEAPRGKPALRRNIKELPEDEVKRDVAEKMSKASEK